MGLTPDDIAHRAFTPSADGYHKREVRTFLERIAAEVRGMQASMPEASAGAGAFSTATHDQQAQLSALQDQLQQAVQEMNLATSELRETQVASAAHLATMQRTSPTSSAAAAPASLPAAPNPQLAEQPDLPDTPPLPDIATDAPPPPLPGVATDTPPPPLPGVQQPTSTDLPDAPPPPPPPPQPDLIDSLPDVPSPASTDLTAGTPPPASTDLTAGTPPPDPEPDRASIIPKAYTEASPSGAVDSPASGTELPAPPPAPDLATGTPGGAAGQLDGAAIFGSDLENEPLFSDNANDLLDGVLDDVMGNLNDKTG